MHLRDYLFNPLSRGRDKASVNFDFACQTCLKIIGYVSCKTFSYYAVTDKAALSMY
jgi:hypothetical protein